MLTMPQRTPRNALYALGARDVRPETLKLVEEIESMFQKGYSKQSIGRAIEVSVLKACNAERKELATLARELDVDASHVEICAATSRLGPSGAANAAISVCRSLFARLCAERISSG
mgnify:CR=1 FL=1